MKLHEISMKWYWLTIVDTVVYDSMEGKVQVPCVATGWLKELDLTRGSVGQALSQLQVGDVAKWPHMMEQDLVWPVRFGLTLGGRPKMHLMPSWLWRTTAGFGPKLRPRCLVLSQSSFDMGTLSTSRGHSWGCKIAWRMFPKIGIWFVWAVKISWVLLIQCSGV